MAEGGFDEKDPLIPHEEEHGGNEDEEGHENHGLDFDENHYSEEKDKRTKDVKERASEVVISYLRKTGLLAPSDLKYTTWVVQRRSGRQEIKLISEDGNNWYEVIAGPKGSGEVALMPAGYNDKPVPVRLYRKIGAEAKDEEEEGGGLNPADVRLQLHQSVVNEVKAKYPYLKQALLDVRQEQGVIEVRDSTKGGNGKWKKLFVVDKKTHERRLNQKLSRDEREALGPSAEEVLLEKREELAEKEARIGRITGRLKTEIDEAERQRLQTEQRTIEEEMEQIEEEEEQIMERLPLKERVKEIFKKHGVTVVGVLTATATVIGVLLSNLRSGLSNVAKGVGNGLKELGKKLAGILPGMVGAIVSFLFKAAGEAVGFLTKHAWLLILLVVTFVVEQFKKKNI